MMDSVDTRILSESVGIFQMQQEADMHRLLAVYLRQSGKTVEEAIKYMIARWIEYQTAMPSLAWTYGSAYKFFTSGNWDRPETWPQRVTASLRESGREARRKAFMEAPTEDGS